jgi:hypothetical protein
MKTGNLMNLMNQVDGSAVFTATVPPQLIKTFRETFDLEVEMLQGKRLELPNGWVSIKLQVTDQAKIDRLKEFFLTIVRDSRQSICEN